MVKKIVIFILGMYVMGAGMLHATPHEEEIDPEDVLLHLIEQHVQSGMPIPYFGNRKTLLHHAAEHGYARTIENVLNAHPGVQRALAGHMNVFAIDDYGNTALHYAADNYYPGIVQLLLAHHSNVNATNNDKSTPLHEACRTEYGYVEDEESLADVICLLIEAGACPVMLDKDGESSLHLLARIVFEDKENREKAVQALIKGGACACQRNIKNGTTPLHQAISMDHDATLDMIKCLVEHGRHQSSFNINVQDATGNTLLHAACLNNKPQVASYLLSCGVHPALRNNKMQTPLMYLFHARKNIVYTAEPDGEPSAHEEDSNNFIKKLITISSADLNARDIENNMLLHYVVACKSLFDKKDSFYEGSLEYTKGIPYFMEIIQEITKQQIPARDIHQQTPLFTALKNVNIRGAAYLLRTGADASACDTAGMTPLGFLLITFKNISIETKRSLAALCAFYNGPKNRLLLNKHLNVHLDRLSALQLNGLGINEDFVSYLKSDHCREETARKILTSYLEEVGEMHGFRPDHYRVRSPHAPHILKMLQGREIQGRWTKHL